MCCGCPHQATGQSEELRDISAPARILFGGKLSWNDFPARCLIYPESISQEDWRRIEAMQGFSKARLELLFRVTMDNGKRAIAMKKKRRMQRERKNGDQATFVEVESPEDNDKPETIDFVPDIEDLSNFIVYEVVDCTSTGENEDHVEVQTSFVDEN